MRATGRIADVMIGRDLAALAAHGIAEEDFPVAECLARSAARSGRPTDIIRLAGVLLGAARLGRENMTARAGEAIACLDYAADLGSELAACLIPQVVAKCPPVAIAYARAHRWRPGVA